MAADGGTSPRALLSRRNQPPLLAPHVAGSERGDPRRTGTGRDSAAATHPRAAQTGGHGERCNRSHRDLGSDALRGIPPKLESKLRGHGWGVAPVITAQGAARLPFAFDRPVFQWDARRGAGPLVVRLFGRLGERELK